MYNNFVLTPGKKEEKKNTTRVGKTIDGGLLRTAAERKNDERILVQIRGKDCVALEVHYHKVFYCNYTKYFTRETTVCIVFCVPKMRNVSEIVYVENLDSSGFV